ncbi:MAG: YbfB/YjiJ family MFS transporter [Rhizobiaceae bacterium]|nr:YbfB/YjiJ family MFS transporter [Rhizobiaceae bacterium]
MLSMAVAMGIGRFVYTPILPGMMAALGQTTSEAGFIAASNYAGYLVGALIAGGGWAHGWERALSLASLALSTALCLAMALTDDFAAFLAIRFAAGVASAFVMVFLSSIVFAGLARLERSDLQWMHFGGVGVGIAASASMVALLALGTFGWRANWVGAAALSLAALVAVSLLLPRGGGQGGSAVKEPALDFTPALKRIVWAYGIFGFGYVVTATFLIAIVRENESGSVLEAVVWLVTGLAVIPSAFLWGLAARRWGLRPAFAIGCAVEGAGVMASVALGGMTGPLVGGILLGNTFVAITALGIQIGRNLAGPSPRKVLSVMTAAFGLGQIVGPVVAGIVADWTGGFFWPSVLAALALAVSAWLALSSKAAAQA